MKQNFKTFTKGISVVFFLATVALTVGCNDKKTNALTDTAKPLVDQTKEDAPETFTKYEAVEFVCDFGRRIIRESLQENSAQEFYLLTMGYRIPDNDDRSIYNGFAVDDSKYILELSNLSSRAMIKMVDSQNNEILLFDNKTDNDFKNNLQTIKMDDDQKGFLLPFRNGVRDQTKNTQICDSGKKINIHFRAVE